MKKAILLLMMLVAASMAIPAQSDPIPQFTQQTDANYRLYPTQNMYNFLKLDRVSKRSISEHSPLLPCGATPDAQGCDSDGPQLYDHLRKVLLENKTTHSHVRRSVPQRGLEYTEPSRFCTMVVRLKSMEQFEWVKQNKWYNIPLQNVASTPNIMKAEQLVFILDNKVVGKAKRVPGKVDVWQKSLLLDADYPNPSQDTYFMLRTHEVDTDYSILVSDLMARITDGNAKTPIYFVEI